MAASRTFVCRRCSDTDTPIDNCPHCTWLSVLAREAEERIEALATEATIAHVPERPSGLVWLLVERQALASR